MATLEDGRPGSGDRIGSPFSFRHFHGYLEVEEIHHGETVHREKRPAEIDPGFCDTIGFPEFLGKN